MLEKHEQGGSGNAKGNRFFLRTLQRHLAEDCDKSLSVLYGQNFYYSQPVDVGE